VFHFLTDPDYRARYRELATASITLALQRHFGVS
jgi:hypothetical protein